MIGALVAWGVTLLERRNRRELRADRIQQAVGQALAREPALADASILPVAGFPAGAPPTLELTGYAPPRGDTPTGDNDAVLSSLSL